jgi:hypothetical protein
MEWIVQEVISYSEITDVLTFGLVSETTHDIVTSESFQREYLSSYTRFNIELLKPWIGYFDDFPDDDLEYRLYSFVRAYVRRICYHLNAQELISLYSASRLIQLFSSSSSTYDTGENVNTIIFIINYGDIAELILLFFIMQLKEEEEHLMSKILNHMMSDTHPVKSDFRRIKTALLLNTSPHCYSGEECQEIIDINSYYPRNLIRYISDLGSLSLIPMTLANGSEVIIDLDELLVVLMGYERLDLNQNGQYEVVFYNLIYSIVTIEDAFSNFSRELREKAEHIIVLMINFIRKALKPDGIPLINEIITPIEAPLKYSTIKNIIDQFGNRLSISRAAEACEPLFHHPRLDPITQELVEVHELGLDI